MTALETLAHYVRAAADEEHYRELAKRCDVSVNIVWRAASPNGISRGGRTYSPVLRESVVRLLDGLELTFAPLDSSTPTVAQITELIWRMDTEAASKAIAAAAVHAAGVRR